MTGPAILIVDDNQPLAKLLARRCAKFCNADVAFAYSDGVSKLKARGDWQGFIVDVHLGDGSGLELLSIALHTFPRAAGALISATHEPSAINAASRLGAMYLCKPFEDEELKMFMERAARSSAPNDPLRREVETIRVHAQLSPREAEILYWVAQGGERDTFIARANISEATFKTHVRHLLEKCGAIKLEALVADVLRRALASNHET